MKNNIESFRKKIIKILNNQNLTPEQVKLLVYKVSIKAYVDHLQSDIKRSINGSRKQGFFHKKVSIFKKFGKIFRQGEKAKMNSGEAVS